MAMQFKRLQRGGTVLGFILGVLVGLAGALAVAVYVTKVPVPFVDRMISRKASEDAAEAERNKNWNPNAALGGKPVKLAPPPEGETPASEASPAADPAPPAKKAKAEPPKPEAESPVPAAQTKAVDANKDTPAVKGKVYSSDPLGDMAQSKAQGKVVSTAPASAAPVDAKPPATAEPFTYFVQVGAFRTPEDAQSQRAKLALMGLDAKVSEREQSGRTVYRVRLGPYEHLVDAERMKDNLAPSGLDSALVRVQR